MGNASQNCLVEERGGGGGPVMGDGMGGEGEWDKEGGKKGGG